MLTLKNRWFFIIISWVIVLIASFIIAVYFDRKDFGLQERENSSATTYNQDKVHKTIHQEASKVGSVVNKNIIYASYAIKKNDSLNSIFDKIKIPYNNAIAVINKLKTIYDPRTIRIGDQVFISYYNNNGRKIKRLVVINDDYLHEVLLKSQGYQAYKIKKKRNLRIRNKEVTITNSLFVDGLEKNISAAIIVDVINKYSYTTDFQRDVRKGDKFHIVFEEYYDNDQKYLGNGKLLYINFKTKRHEHKIYYFEDKNSHIRYFNDDGTHIKSSFLMTPINGARISSGYGYRRHPILGYNKIHEGIDFAAPKGTPIFAAADGSIEKRGYRGAYGNSIVIKHGSGKYKTSYSHMSRFNKKFRIGSRVKQGDVIGYVGTTGRSTGNHLHYEVIENGKKINPKSVVKSEDSYKLKGSSLKAFNVHKNFLEKLVTSMDLE